MSEGKCNVTMINTSDKLSFLPLNFHRRFQESSKLTLLLMKPYIYEFQHILHQYKYKFEKIVVSSYSVNSILVMPMFS